MCLGPLSIYRCRVYIYVVYAGNREPRHHAQRLSHMHIYILIYIYIYVYIYRCMHMYVKIYAHPHIYIYTYIMDVSCVWIYVDMYTTLFHRGDTSSMDQTTLCNMLQHTASHCNTGCGSVSQCVAVCAFHHFLLTPSRPLTSPSLFPFYPTYFFPYCVAPNSRSTLATSSSLFRLATARGVSLNCSMRAQRHE